MKQFVQILPFLFLLAICSCTQKQYDVIDLSGEWQFQMDIDDRGIAEKWYEKDLPESIQLPGSMVENGKGQDITLETEWTGGVRNPQWYNHPNYAPYHDAENIRFPFWLQPEKKYTGAAWYRKNIDLPKGWNEKPVFLNLERVHWESLVWVNNQYLEMQKSLAAPHVYNISGMLNQGKNTITICVDNRTKEIDVGHNSHSISDHTQSNWNGIVGDISLKAKGKVFFKNLAVFPDVENKSVAIRTTVFNTVFKQHCAPPVLPVSNCSIYTIFRDREPHWLACSTRSGKKKATFRPKNSGGFPILPFHWPDSKNAFLLKAKQ